MARLVRAVTVRAGGDPRLRLVDDLKLRFATTRAVSEDRMHVAVSTGSGLVEVTVGDALRELDLRGVPRSTVRARCKGRLWHKPYDNSTHERGMDLGRRSLPREAGGRAAP